MNTAKKTLVAATLIGGCVLSAIALADPMAERCGCGPMGAEGHHRHGWGGPGESMGAAGWMGFVTRKLDLSPAQEEEVKAILEQGREDARPLRQELSESRAKERRAIEEGASERALKKLARASADKRVELVVLGRAIEERVRGLLTAEQSEQLANHKAARKERMQKRMEKWRQCREDRS